MMNCFSDEVPFLSVIIPAYNRFSYLQELVDSIHQQADFPFELLVHDDNSTRDQTKEQLPTLRSKLSATIFSHGLNLGLAESINRLVRLASSNYILMLNADMKIEKPIFQDTVNVLQCPYVGYITFMSVYGNVPNGIENNGTKFILSRGLGSGCAMAFTKNVWNQVNGWNNKTAATGNADVAFMIKVVKNGYFPTMLMKNPADPLVRNMSQLKANSLDSTIGRQPYDCSLPRLFNYEPYLKQSVKRYTAAADAMQLTYPIPEGETNLDFWHKFLNELITADYTVNWQIAERYGHHKWREQIKLEPAAGWDLNPRPPEPNFLTLTTPQTTRELVKDITEKIYTTQNADELMWLVDKVKMLNPTAILEIGVDSGGTLKAWEQTLKQNGNSILIGVDNNPNVQWDIYSSKVSINIIQGYSYEPGILQQIEEVLKDRKLDFIFIDAQHTPAAARRDTEMYQHLLKPCGAIGYHDANDVSEYLNTLDPKRIEKFFKLPPYSDFGEKATIGIALYYAN
jgi:glycosyltransferase involved in cell wall biosynthesis/23S rRNA U2552 (ribose-2'-O)-methylase RlmE/FtsJ